jgi:Holliday junction DNA helicase RuvB
MEDYALDIIIGKGPAAKSVRLKLPVSRELVPQPFGTALGTLESTFRAVYRMDYMTRIRWLPSYGVVPGF